MDQELIDMGPELWTVPDLDGPSPDCPMPEPIRPPGSCGVWFTCPHCVTTYILVQCSNEDQVGWHERWVNSHQHMQMCQASDRMEEERYWNE